MYCMRICFLALTNYENVSSRIMSFNCSSKPVTREDFESKIGRLEYSIGKYEIEYLNSRIDLNLKMNQNFSELRVIVKK